MEEFWHAGPGHHGFAVWVSSNHRDPDVLLVTQSTGPPMRRVFRGFKAKIIMRWLTAGKAVATHSYANNSNIGRDAARRIVEAAVVHGTSIDRRQLETDILILTRAPAGVPQLEQALASSGEDNAPLMVRTLIGQVMADLACQADLVPRQVCVWSVFCLTALWAGAAVILVGADLDLISRLIWLAGLAAALSSIGLAVTGLATFRRRTVLAEVELIRALAAACESFEDDPAAVASDPDFEGDLSASRCL